MTSTPFDSTPPPASDPRSRRQLRSRRRRRKAYIRSVYFLPSLATLGNAVCGFGAIYVCHLNPADYTADPWTHAFATHRFLAACYLILLAMLFDALDGRLARWARHTTDFGGQLDSMADVISFGAAPAMIALALFKHEVPGAPLFVSRLVWAIGAVYVSCAAIRLARFNVSNEHGEQAHMSFLGLPSPGAGAAVIGLVMVQQELRLQSNAGFYYENVIWVLRRLGDASVYALPALTLAAGLLMVSNFRYPHLVNKYLRGRRTIGRLVATLLILVLLVTAHRYTVGLSSVAYAMSAPIWFLWLRRRAAKSVAAN
ncbi:MAG TPA: CDP-alcohol phosphatidyltransferase family protein [Tepidisphaeraceae bacterium]